MTKSILSGIWTFRKRASFCNGKEDHLAMIRYMSCDLKQRVFLDCKSFSESRVHDVWVLDGVCAMVNGTNTYQYLEVHLGHGFHLSVRCSRCPQSGDLCRKLALHMDSAVRAPGPCGKLPTPALSL